MDDFGDIVYLDVQKTGSSFISAFLKGCANSETRVFKKHGRIESGQRRDAIYFISTRNPIDQYFSLFRYGCDRKGGLFRRLSDRKLEHMYRRTPEAFERWMQFVLSYENADLLGEGYPKVNADLMGYQSFRFLVLSFEGPMRKLRKLQSYEELQQLYQHSRLHSAVLRNESLRDDLEKLSETLLADHIDKDAARTFLRQMPALNTSSTVDFGIGALSRETRALLAHKERFLFENFYPDALK